MKIRITRQTSIKSEEQDSIVLVQATESFHFIESDSAIGVQAICKPSLRNDETQVQFLGT